MTQLGREMIPVLRRGKRDSEAEVLDYILRAETATLEQIAYAVRQEEATLLPQLKTYWENRWVRRQTRPASQI